MVVEHPFLATAYAAQLDVMRIRAAAEKLLLCFPPGTPEDGGPPFDIPGYIIEELREALKKRKDG
jgi:hypothetical protein